jgi:rhodanese-related sulfurtransferase
MSKSKWFFTAAMAVFIFAAGTAPVLALDAASVPLSNRTKADLYLSSKEVPAFLKANSGHVLFLDVRTPRELTSSGLTPLIDANVPFKRVAAGGMQLEINPDFAAKTGKRLAAKGLSKNDPVVLMCRSGHRSAMAADLLTEAGFTQVYSVADGFEGNSAGDNGWKNSGLSWGYELDKAKFPAGECPTKTCALNLP